MQVDKEAKIDGTIHLFLEFDGKEGTFRPLIKCALNLETVLQHHVIWNGRGWRTYGRICKSHEG